MQEDIVLSTKEAINYLKISRPTYVKYIRQGRIKGVKAGNGWRVLLSELNRFLRGEGLDDPDVKKRRKRKVTLNLY